MPASLLEVLRTIPDRRRDEGKRFDLATVLLYAVLSMVAGANSYRQMHEFIRIHLQRLNGAFGLRLRCSPSYTGLRLHSGRRSRGVGGRVPTARVLDFGADPFGRFVGDRRRRQDVARQFRRLQRPQGGAHDVGAAASRSNRARPSDGRGEEQRDSGRARADRGPRPEGLCIHARRRTRPKKSFERVIASGNHLLTQVKDNQPSLRRRLELGVAGRKPSGSAKTETAGRNRWETRELTVFPAKAWFRDTPWEKLIKTVLWLERTVCKRAPATGLCAQTTEVVFWISSASNQTPQRWNEWIRAHWRIENASHYVRDTAFAEDASRIRKNPDIAARLRSFAYNLIRAAGGSNIRNARWRAALDLNLILQLPRLH